jgi:Family of unknown function (DUF6065)
MEKTPKISFDSEAYHYSDSILKVFRVHPQGVRIEKAEKTLHGRANKDALKWCGPYVHANQIGWWVYPGFDLDITCYEEPQPQGYTGRWGGNYVFNAQGYDNSDHILMHNFDNQISSENNRRYLGKQHYSIDEPEKNCFTMWTGCFFQMPKDWSLLIKTPGNIGLIYEQASPVCVQEGILELDWMRYDIWMNFKFHTFGKTLSLRKDQEWPIAQLIPVHRSSYDINWVTQDKIMDPNDEECVKVYDRYTDYNFKKWILQNEKDPFAFRKLRKSEINKCPVNHLFPENS